MINNSESYRQAKAALKKNLPRMVYRDCDVVNVPRVRKLEVFMKGAFLDYCTFETVDIYTFSEKITDIQNWHYDGVAFKEITNE